MEDQFNKIGTFVGVSPLIHGGARSLLVVKALRTWHNPHALDWGKPLFFIPEPAYYLHPTQYQWT